MNEGKRAIDSLSSLKGVSLSEKEKDNLEEEVRRLMKKDLRGQVEVHKGLKTEATFQRSLGDIYHYLKDREICENCPKHLPSCPLPVKGFPYAISYEQESDTLKSYRAPCIYQQEKENSLNRIYPCDVPKESLYQNLDSFLKLLKKGENLAKIKDIATLLVDGKKKADLLKDAKKPLLGYSLYSLHSETLSNDLLKALCFLYARKGYKTSYIVISKWLASFSDKDLRVREEAKYDLQRISSLPVLFLEGFDLYPRYLSPQFNKENLLPLLKARSQGGKVTYLSLSTPLDLNDLLRSLLRGTGEEGKAEQYASFFPVYPIKDYDLR